MVGGKHTDLLEKMINDAVKALVKSGVNADEAIKKINLNKVFEPMPQIIDNISDDIVCDLIDDLNEKIDYENEVRNSFFTQQEKIWGEAFKVFEAMYWIATEAYSMTIKHISFDEGSEMIEKKYRFLSISEIFARSCQVYLEIYCLMRNGFSDGAYARWRTLFELSVVAEFIYNNTEEVAKAFFENKDKKDDKYKWAEFADCFKKGEKISFNKLKNECKYVSKDWKEHYELSNKIVHATPQATFRRLSYSGKNEHHFLLVGESSYGHETPGEHAAISFSTVSRMFFSLVINIDNAIVINILDKWIDIVRYEFFSVSKKMEEKENVSEWLEKFRKANNFNYINSRNSL